MVSRSSSSLSLLLQRLIVVLFHLLVIIVPFIFTWVNEELFEFPKMLLTYSLTVAILGLWIARMSIEQRLLLRRTAFDLPIALFVASQLLSTLFSIHPHTSLFGYYTRFHGGLFSTLTYVALFYAFVNTVKKSQILAIVISLLVAAAGVSLYALPEHFGRSPSCYLISGGQNFGVDCWVQDVQNRIFGTFGQPNWLAAYVVLLTPVALSVAVTQFISLREMEKVGPDQRRSWLKMVLGGASLAIVALLFSILLFTQSRSGLAGLLGGLSIWAGVVLWYTLRWRSASPQIWWAPTKTMLIVTTICALSLLSITQLIGEPFAPNFNQVFSRYFSTSFTTSSTLENKVTTNEVLPVANRLDIGGTDSGEIRSIVWSGAWNVFKRYPLLGSGVETFAYSYYQDRPMAHNLVSEWDFLYNKAHNEFLNYLATTGVVGLVSYSALLIWFGVVSLQLLATRQETVTIQEKYLIIGFLAGVVGLSISNFFGFSTVMVTIIMYLSFAIVAVLHLTPEKTLGTQKTGKVVPENVIPENQVFPSTLSGLQGLSLAGTGISVLYGLWLIWTTWSADYAYTLGKQYLQAGYTLDGLQYLESATTQSPQEALFYDELANTYALVAASLHQQGNATAAAEFSQAALTTSTKTIVLNPRHLNFIKSRARVFINLAGIDPANFQKAETSLIQAISLAPTDAKLRYNLALVEAAQGKTAQSASTLDETVRMKANYEAARLELARYYRSQKKFDQATEQYVYILSYINAQNTVATQELDQLNREATQSAQTKP